MTVLSGAEVILYNEDASITVTTDTDGHINFKDIPFGDYTLTIIKEGYERYVHDSPIRIRKGKLNNYNFNISLKKIEEDPDEGAGEVTDTTTDTDPTNTRTLNIKLSPEDAEGEILLEGDEYTQTIQYPADSVFLDVPFGVYNLSVKCPDYELFTKTVHISKVNKNPRQIRVTLTPQ